MVYLTNATKLLYYVDMKSEAKKSAEKACLEWGFRKSKMRLLLFEFLESAQKPVTVPEILEWCRRKNIYFNKTTVYREIEHLVSQGILQAVQLTSRVVSYELASREHHHHFVCTSCEFVTDVQFPEANIKKTEALIEQEGMLVTHHSLEFFGLCKTCS